MGDNDDKGKVNISIGGDNTGDILVDNVIHTGGETSTDTPPASAETLARRTQLRDLLTSKFNDEDLHSLAFQLGIDYEDLPGQSKSAKVRELVAYCERHDLLTTLTRTLQELRPAAFE